MMKLIALCCMIAVGICSPIEQFYNVDGEPVLFRHIEKRAIELPLEQEEGYYYYPEESYVVERQRRSLQPGAPGFPNPNQQPPTSITPHVTKQDGTTNIGAVVSHKTPNSEVTGHWEKNVRGPGRAKPNWGVRGTYRW